MNFFREYQSACFPKISKCRARQWCKSETPVLQCSRKEKQTFFETPKFSIAHSNIHTCESWFINYMCIMISCSNKNYINYLKKNYIIYLFLTRSFRLAEWLRPQRPRPHWLWSAPPRLSWPTSNEFITCFYESWSWSLLQRRKRIVIYYVKKFVKKSQ